MSIKIIELLGVNDDKRNEIANYLIDTFGKVVTARSTQVEGNYQRWIDNYNAKPQQEVRTTPFPGASNFMPQLIRMHTDILTARTIGILFGTRPFWRPTTFLSNVPADMMNSLSAWMQYICFNKIQFFPTIDAIVHDGFKVGTVTGKTWWDETTKFQVRNVDSNGKPVETAISEKDLRFDIVPFEDFYPFPLTAKNLKHVKIKFHRLRMTKDTVMFRKNMKIWDGTACDYLMAAPSSVGGSMAQQQSLQNSGISLTPDIGQPYDAIEAQLDYELQPGKRYPIVVVFNPKIKGKDSILRMYYKPGANPFLESYTDFRFLPRTDSYYGDSIPKILEDSQEEQAQIHNSRRDANTIANVPGWKKKRYADVGNPSQEWYPGKVFELDNMDDLVPLISGVNYNSLVEEEQFLLSLAAQYSGVTPAMSGMGAGVNGKKGSYASQGTLAMISEGNRRIDTYIKRCRYPFNSLGNQIYQSYRDFGDADDWKDWGTHAANLQQLFSRDGVLGGGKTFFELSASDAGANRETDRSGLLLMANTMSSYYHELVQAAQAIVQAPQGSPFQNIMLEVMDGARDLANRLLFVFDIGDREKLLPDMRKLLGNGQQPTSGPQAQPGGSLVNGLPEPAQDVSVGGVSDLSNQLTQIANSVGSRTTQ